MRIRVTLLFVLVFAAARTAERLELTVETLARGPGLVGYPPQDVRWSGDGKRLFFRWKQASDPRDKDPDPYTVNADGSGLRKLSEDEEKQAPPSSFADFTPDRKKAVYARAGDLWLYDFSNDTARRLTKTADTESNPRFLRDGRRISFVRSGNLYVMSLDGGMLEQLTDIRAPGAASTGQPAAEPVMGGGRRGGFAAPPPVWAQSGEQRRGTDAQEALKKQERELLEVIRERAKKREEDEARRKRENPRKPFQLQARQSVVSLQLAPDEKRAIAQVVVAPADAKNAIVPSFVTESAFTETISSRTKVGDPVSRARLAIINVETGEVKWVEHGIKRQEGEKQVDREVSLSMPVWSQDGTKAVVPARAADNKDRWIFALDAAEAKLRILNTEHDDAWLDGPMSYTLGWLKSDDAIYFGSERTGWAHLYTVPWSGGEAKALTSGQWEVQAVELSRDRSRIFLETNEGDHGQKHLYSMSAAGGERVKLTSAPGFHSAVLSPGETRFADVCSYATKPPELYVQDATPGAESKKLTDSPAPDYWTYPWPDPVFVSVPARDGVKVPGRLYKAAGTKRGSPAVLFVHGAGYAQNVHKGWSQYYRESLFNQILMKNGFVVLDIDYRGSAGYGRNWRTAIYRHMGGQDLEDHVDAVKWLVKEHGVDPKRIGIYGGSYGGFMTLMALFTEPDMFAAGAALRPVTDWAHYNNGYTSNILNLPQKDGEAYRKSSPIDFAQNLKGALLICHGMVDTNVHFQDTVRLVERLIELKKEHWELAVYPVEDHSFVRSASWLDEYRRIWKLFDRELRGGR